MKQVSKLAVIMLAYMCISTAACKAQETYAGVSVMPQAVWFNMDLGLPGSGYSAGFHFIRSFSKKRWAIETNLFFSYQKGGVTCNFISFNQCGGGRRVEKWYLMRLPVLVHYNIFNNTPLHIAGGFQASYMLRELSTIYWRYRPLSLDIVGALGYKFFMTEQFDFLTQIRITNNLTNPRASGGKPNNVRVGMLIGIIFKK